MDDALIVTIYVVIDDTMKLLGHRSHCLRELARRAHINGSIISRLERG